RKVADVQAVMTIIGSAIGCLANEDRVVAVFRNCDRHEWILLGERGIVDRCELETILVEHRHERGEKSLPKAKAFDFYGEPLPLLGMDAIVIGVFVLQRAGDTDVRRDLLRLVEIVIRLFFINFGKSTDEK